MMRHVKRLGLSTTAKVVKELLKRLLLPKPLKQTQRPDHSGLRPDFDDSHFDRPDDRMSAVPGVNFCVDRREVVLYRLLTDEHVAGNFWRLLTFGEKLENFHFAIAQNGFLMCSRVLGFV